MKKLIFGLFLLSGSNLYAQYAPQAGITGSTAIAAGSSSFINWATGCAVQRGYLQISDPNQGFVTAGITSQATGGADGSIVSLGDSGVAVMTFDSPIINGPGADFAVFENGFLNPNNSEEAFLELAFVEVSSDGAHFFRFPAISLTQDSSQLSSVIGMNYMNARLLNNLAGKYISGYGTPFDLQELAGTTGLDVNHVTHVRIIDVVGAVDSYGCRDSAGHKINDPFPTAFPTGGFDLDGVGVIHQLAPSAIGKQGLLQVRLFPNPVSDQLYITAPKSVSIQLHDATGRLLLSQQFLQRGSQIPMAGFSTGIYYITAQDENGNRWSGKVFRQ